MGRLYHFFALNISIFIFYAMVVDIIGPGGQIKGCFDETFEGITVSKIVYLPY